MSIQKKTPLQKEESDVKEQTRGRSPIGWFAAALPLRRATAIVSVDGATDAPTVGHPGSTAHLGAANNLGLTVDESPVADDGVTANGGITSDHGVALNTGMAKNERMVADNGPVAHDGMVTHQCPTAHPGVIKHLGKAIDHSKKADVSRRGHHGRFGYQSAPARVVVILHRATVVNAHHDRFWCQDPQVIEHRIDRDETVAPPQMGKLAACHSTLPPNWIKLSRSPRSGEPAMTISSKHLLIIKVNGFQMPHSVRAY
jgi:hypothetical protein